MLHAWLVNPGIVVGIELTAQARMSRVLNLIAEADNAI
jgi:hypothetical protein